MKYRKEIDGLRALAVLPVVMNHANISGFSGGFVGVDVFFVISGFLISQIIHGQVVQGSFSILEFYERRARRILPALMPVCVFSLICGYFLLLPDFYENLAESVVATLLFSNNILLAMTSGYWQLESSFKPLLHTWSLGVEEQFYIFYPVIVLFSAKFGGRVFNYTLIAGLVFSFALSVALTPVYPNASFYLIHTRAWELFSGALAAYYMPRLKCSDAMAGAISMLGVMLIVFSIVLFSELLPYPSFYAAVPCVGAVLALMFTRSGSLAYRTLTIPAAVSLGMMSYSVYLWHQPIFAFARTLSLRPPEKWEMFALSLCVLGISYFSWKYVEQPFRDRSRFTARQIYSFAGIGGSAVLATGLAIYALSGLPARVPGMGLGGGRYIAYNESAFGLKKDKFEADNRPHILVIGNSTGRDLVNIMRESGKFTHDDIIYRDDVTPCNNRIPVSVRHDLFKAADAVVVAANWNFDGGCSMIDFDDPLLRGKPYVFVGPKHFGYNLNAFMHLKFEDRKSARAFLLADTMESNNQFKNSVKNGHYVDLLNIMDSRFEGLPVFDGDGRILSADRVHLTKAGAVLFANQIFDAPAWGPILHLADKRPASSSALSMYRSPSGIQGARNEVAD